MSEAQSMLVFEHAALTLQLRADEHSAALGAFRAEVVLLVEHDTGSLRYEARDIWVPDGVFDAFEAQVRAIVAGSQDKAVLADMSEFVVWEMWHEDGLLAGELEIDEPVPGTGETKLRFELEAPLSAAEALVAALDGFTRPGLQVS